MNATVAKLTPTGTKILSVTELTQEVKGMLEGGFASVWVAGEISNLARPPSGHIYLSLKDKGAQIKAVLWRSTVQRLRFDCQDGLEVIARGKLSVYPARGDYQLIIDQLQPKGLGALELGLRQLKEKLRRLGYFAAERKRPLPLFPRRVALVTSPSGAAVRDMLKILGRRWPAAAVWVCPVRVQGDGAGTEIAAALRLLNRLPDVSVIIVGRGGGSTEDLWAFNEECVAHAIFQSLIPVVSAVGHEIDVTIADMVADLRALTPSEAAERVTPHQKEMLEGLRSCEASLRTLLWQRLETARKRLGELGQRRAFRMPLERLREQERRLDDWGERLGRAARQQLVRARDQLTAQAAHLETLSPLNVLGRGYSLTRKAMDNSVIRDPEQVQVGDQLVTHVQHGRILSRVCQG
jgi:exodeoxyribonuclease VII large subunit